MELTALCSVGLIVEIIKARQRAKGKDKGQGQHDFVEPFTRMAVGATGMPRRSGVSTPGGFSVSTSLRREKCGIAAKPCNLCIKYISQEGALLDSFKPQFPSRGRIRIEERQ
jgi:hypothetical protein